MESKETSDLTKDNVSVNDNHEPKILRRKSANKVTKRVTFDPDSTLLPSYPKKPVNDSSGESVVYTEIVNIDSKSEIKHLFKKNSSLDLETRLPILSKNTRGTKTSATKLKSEESSDDLMPNIVKSSIQLKQENSVTAHLNSIIKYSDFFPLDLLIKYFEKAQSQRRNFVLVSFDGLESTTDLVFYLLYKYFKNNELWSKLKTVTLDSCRYVTDFGIEILYEAVGRSCLIDRRTCTGCKKLFKYLHIYEEKYKNEKDIFMLPSYAKLSEQDEKNALNNCKILVLNDSNFKFIKYIEEKQYHKVRTTVDCGELIFSKTSNDGNTSMNYKFNLIEVDWNCSRCFTTPSSIVVICVDFDTLDSMSRNISNKIMQLLSLGLDYLELIVLIANNRQKIETETLLSIIKTDLSKIVNLIQKEEDDFFNTNKDKLNQIDFNEQERMRDKLRTKFHIEKFLNANFKDDFHLVELAEHDAKAYDRLIDKLKSLTRKRFENTHYTQLRQISNQKKYKQKCIKLEDFIDDVYSNDSQQFKTIIQTKTKYSNLVDDFLQFNHFLGECIYVKLNSGQHFIIFDIKWFFNIIKNVLQPNELIRNILEYNQSTNMAYLKSDIFKNQAFMDEFKIADSQQAELVFELIKQFNLIMRIENEKENLIVLPNCLRKDILAVNYFKSYWSNDLSGCFQATCVYEFYYALSNSIIIQIMECFLRLAHVNYISNDCLICHEGCFSIFIKYYPPRKRLELSVRTANLTDLFQHEFSFKDDLFEFKNSILCLINEYKIVVDGVLFENSIPFYYFNDKLENFTHIEKSCLHSNFKYKLNYITSVSNTKPEDFLVSEHNFKALNQFEASHTFFKCKECNVNESWSKLVYGFYRKMYPMLNSEKNWSLRVNLNGIIADAVKPERKSTVSLFYAGDETVSLYGTEQMSPFYFDIFKLTLTSLCDATSIRVGVSIVKESTLERQTVYLNLRTRRLHLITEKIEFISNKTGEKQIHHVADSDENLSEDFIRSQRYTKEYRNKIIKLPDSVKSPANITVEEKNKRARLMEQIANLRRDPNVLSSKISKPETWLVKGGDIITIKLFAKELNSCEVNFYFNNEKIGYYLIQDLSLCQLYPYASSKGGQTRFFFDMSSTRFKSILANDYGFKKGMYLEAEYKIDQENKTDFKKTTNIIAPALIEKVNDNGYLLIRLLDSKLSFLIEPSSKLIHPCGYWQYFQKELNKSINSSPIDEFKIESSLKKYETSGQFSWLDYFKFNVDTYPASFSLFTMDQKGNMSKLFFPEIQATKNNYLDCSFKFNPRYVWSSLKQLSLDDLTDLYRETGIITIRDDPERNKAKIFSSGLILLPEEINQKFIIYPNINRAKNVSNLNVTCTHREDIKLNIGMKTFISNSYPHLLKGEPYDLIKTQSQLHLKHLFLIMCTSLDLNNSTNDPLFPNFSEKPEFKTKEFNDSLRSYFRQLANCISLILPLFYSQQFRFNKLEQFKKSLLIEACFTYFGINTKSDEMKRVDNFLNPIDDYIYDRIQEFEISSNCLCKYCNMFNINVLINSSFGSSNESLDSFLLKKIETNQEYSKIITSIKLQTDDKEKTIHSISLTSQLLDHLPNIGNISIKNIKINKIDSSLNKCLNLRNIELIQNDLIEFPSNLFKEIEMCSLQQIIIDNNPITELPAELFLMESLRSLVLTRLNITSLPDNWLNDDVNISGIKSVHIAQTKLRTLPADLIIGNYSLEQLTFQGVHLIIPENESQWSYLMVDLNKFKSLYCPNLISYDEAKIIFQKFDNDKNNLLDYKELQQLNAYLFKNFPRLGEESKIEEENNNEQTKKFQFFLHGRELLTKIYKCHTLTYLDLSFQAIKKISSDIKYLKNLKVLKLKYCVYLETLSSSLGMLKLNELDLSGCLSLKTPPIEIQRRGVNSVLAYLNRLMTGSVQCKRTKLMIQGLGGVGKTSLMQALLHRIYQNESAAIPNVTDGISICDWTIPMANKEGEKEDLTFSVFDFAGQTVYYNTHQFFLTNRSIYLLVWNVRLGAEHSGLDFWLNSIDCHAPLCPIFIVGTHIDQVNKYDLPIEKLKKSYPQINGFFFVSSSTGDGIDDLSKAIINAALNEKYMGEKIPKCWLQFENALKEMKQDKNVLDYSEVEKIASNYGIFDQVELAQTIQFLHDLGSLMHFNNEFLRNKVVINPQYMVDLMACLVSVNNNYIQNGKLYHSDIDKIWNKYDPSLHSWILKVTEKFDLSFAVTEQALNLVPCLMPETPEDSSFYWPNLSNDTYNSGSRKKETKIIYEFDYLPAGLFNRAQCRLFQITNNKVIWKNGSLLVKNNHLALITRENDCIEVKVQGVQPENIIFLIHEVIEVLIAESFSGVTYDFSFPCPDCFDQGVIDTEKSMYSATLIRRATKMNAVFLQCRHYFHVVPIIDLHARMPPDSTDNYDLQLRHAMRDLKHLKEELVHDIVIIYSINDTLNESILHPRIIKQDLTKNGYSCWFTENADTVSVESIAIILHSASLVLFCMSDNFAYDKICSQIFHYTKLVLNKQYILVALGESFEWQTSEIGALCAHELFIKINKKERYKTSFPDLLDLVKKRLVQININVENKKKNRQMSQQIFISYCRSNSHDAIAKGTPLKSKDALGWADPRSVKTFLENEGYSCWIDFEQVGSKKTLYEDIVDGIRNAKLVIACVSNEYAKSENCMKEFRFASNIKVPILMCTFGSADVKCEWRNTELGIISCLMTKEINFQLENPNAYQSLLSEIKLLEIIPAIKDNKKLLLDDDNDTTKLSEPDEAGMAFNELFELTQRKFLRLIASFSDTASSRPFPRLFTIDIVKDDLGQQINLNSRLCIKSLCENESGWHLTGQSIEYESLSNIPELHFAYLIRIMSLIKQSDLELDVLKITNKLDEFINYLEENLERANRLEEITFKDSYNSIKNYLLNKLEVKSSNLMTGSGSMSSCDENLSNKNQNRIEHFKLNRCGLPSGKVLWLCDQHSQSDHVQILTSNQNISIVQYQNDEFNSILFEELKKYDN